MLTLPTASSLSFELAVRTWGSACEVCANSAQHRADTEIRQFRWRRIGALAICRNEMLSGLGGQRAWIRARSVAFRVPTFDSGALRSPDGNCLVTGGSDQTVCVWALANGGQLLVLHGSVHVVAGVHFVDDGNRVVARSHRWQGPSYMRVWRAPDELDLGS
ncbi:MAG: hypothetical protein ACI8UD_000748 [Planctomycetota bacterium]|jgi:hypothetical protein